MDWGYRPVWRLPLAGEQTPDVEYAFAKRMPLDASRSMLGVCTESTPYHPKCWPRSWQVIINMLGLVFTPHDPSSLYQIT